MLKRLPPLPALDVLSISHISNGHETQQMLNALPAAPNLTVLHFRIVLADNNYEIYTDFTELLQALPWYRSEDPSQSTKNAIKDRFPLIRTIGFYFCVSRNSILHFKRGLRRRMERRLKTRLQEIGAEVAEYLEVGWLDDKFNPVVYSKTNGKPSWKFDPPSNEPESETSDCEPGAGSYDLELEALWDGPFEDM